MYFDMVFNRPFASTGTWTTHGNGAYVSFDTAANPVVEAKVGISYVSTANAVRNRTTENPGWNFNEVRGGGPEVVADHARQDPSGGRHHHPTDRLLHGAVPLAARAQCLQRRERPVHGGRRQGPQVVAPQTAQYANYSGWDIYRSEIPLEAHPGPAADERHRHLHAQRLRPDRPAPQVVGDNGEAYIMVGDPADAIIADAYAFGATGFNTQEALTDMEAEATVPNDIRPGLTYYESDGYLPVDGTYGCCNFYGAVSTQEEYDTADNAIAQFATAWATRPWLRPSPPGPRTGRTSSTRAAVSSNRRTARASSSPASTPVTSPAFVEADSYVYTAEVPFDVQGLIAAEGGDAAWVAYLNGLTSSVTARARPRSRWRRTLVRHPLGVRLRRRPVGTEQVVREIQDQLYTDTPGGLAGNDDLGAMSSWYVWSALGGYPETPGSAEIWPSGARCSPPSPSIWPTARTITETAPGAADQRPLCPGPLTVNGKRVERPPTCRPASSPPAGR
jgi:putative alpha-1,2-mannosidase